MDWFMALDEPPLQPLPTATTPSAASLTATRRNHPSGELHGRVFDLSSHMLDSSHSCPSPSDMDWRDAVASHARDDPSLGTFDVFALVMNRVIGAHVFGGYLSNMGILLASPEWQLVAKTLEILQVAGGHLGRRISSSTLADFLAKARWKLLKLLSGHPRRRISHSPALSQALARHLLNFEVAFEAPVIFVNVQPKCRRSALRPWIQTVLNGHVAGKVPSRGARLSNDTPGFPKSTETVVPPTATDCEQMFGDWKTAPSFDTSSHDATHVFDSTSYGVFETETGQGLPHPSPAPLVDSQTSKSEERNHDWNQFAAATSLWLALPDLLGSFFEWSSHQPCPEPSRFQQTMMLSV